MDQGKARRVRVLDAAVGEHDEGGRGNRREGRIETGAEPRVEQAATEAEGASQRRNEGGEQASLVFGERL